MKRLWWEFEHLLPYLGLPGLLGIALLLIAGVLELGVRPPLDMKRQQVEQQIAKLSLKPLRPSVAPVEPQLFDGFQPVGQVPAYLQQIMQIAAKNGLSIPRGQYQVQPPESGSLPVLRYTLNLPLSGSYPAIRSFSEQVRTSIPGIALTQLSFTRESPQSPIVQASVEFTLWLKEGAQ